MIAVVQKTAVTGIKPTGTPHLGNYLGMIKPALELAADYQSFYFIADYHALTTIRDSVTLRQYTYEAAATWLALGLDPERVVLYRQSDITEVFELAWILSCSTAKGLLNRAHAYKAAADANTSERNPIDEGVNAGLYNYPILMAADILLFGTQVVPVGQDQKQHIEIARDIASTFNHTYGDIMVLPDALIRDDVKLIPGTDGRKMSKSYGNTIQVFAPPDQLRKSIMRIVTDSKSPDDVKDPETCNLFAIYRHFASASDVEQVRQQYLAGGLAYGALKQTLFERLNETFAPARERYNALMQDTDQLDDILGDGAHQARTLARPMLDAIRARVGV